MFLWDTLLIACNDVGLGFVNLNLHNEMDWLLIIFRQYLCSYFWICVILWHFRIEFYEKQRPFGLSTIYSSINVIRTWPVNRLN